MGGSFVLRKVYASEIKAGGCYLRPYMLGYRQDFGLSGMCEPDQMVLLAQLMLQEGFFGHYQCKSVWFSQVVVIFIFGFLLAHVVPGQVPNGPRLGRHRKDYPVRPHQLPDVGTPFCTLEETTPRLSCSQFFCGSQFCQN